MTQNDAFEKFMVVARAWQGADSLDGDYLVDPPEDDFGYFNTPANSLTFLTMGVDGVHTALLKIDGEVRENSPVVYVTPSDDAEWTILAPTFLDFLADGCDASTTQISRLLDDVGTDPTAAMQFLIDTFDGGRLLDEHRVAMLNEQYLGFVETKAEYIEMQAQPDAPN